MKTRFLGIFLLFPAGLGFHSASITDVLCQDEVEPGIVVREELMLEGFTLRVDRTLLDGGSQMAAGRKALALAKADFTRINFVVPPDIVSQWQKFVVVIDWDHPLTDGMQYHPSAKWLESNGYSVELAKCIHIANTNRYISSDHAFVQPSAMIHEMAHAFHDQVLGFDEPKIRAAFNRAQIEGQYESVLFVKGGKRRHYALTNHKEYFAEATEAWFGTNDFYPFVRAELKEHDPRMFDRVRAIYSPQSGAVSEGSSPAK
ncbi:MAG: metallopeptidase [Verrucomicrobiota bacterium]